MRFDQARQVLPEAIVGMVRKTQGPAALEKYLKKLGEKRNPVAGLLEYQRGK